MKWSQPEPGMRPYLTVTAVCVDENGGVIATQDIVAAGDDITVTAYQDCEEPGRTVYSATVELDGESETYTRTVTDIAPTGHWWGADEDVTWSEDDSEVTFHFHCQWPWGTGHTADVTAAVERTTVKHATCTEDGELLLTAAAQMGGTTATAQKAEAIPALGHDFHDGVCSRCGAKDPNYVEPTEKPDTTPSPTPVATPGAESTGTGRTTAPDTGDDAALLPWTALLLACVGALVFLTRRRRTDGRSR